MRFIPQKYGRSSRSSKGSIVQRVQYVQWVQEVQRVQRVQLFNTFKGSRSSKVESRGYFRELDGFIRINDFVEGGNSSLLLLNRKLSEIILLYKSKSRG
jgi:hypothetical protein